MARAVGVDLGGTNVRAAVVDERGRLYERAEAPSVEDPQALCATVVGLVRGLGVRRAAGVGVGAAGIIDFERGHYRFGPNTGLRDVALGRVLSEALGVPVRVDNDANVAAWAEHRFGAGRGTRNFLCVTLGTGIGGGIVANGLPYRGGWGGAAEIGHMLVDPGGPPCGCGRRGCWEQFASGRALERLGREGLVHEPRSVLWRWTGGDPSRLEGPMITRAAREGDRFARELVEGVARWVGWGLGSLVNVLEPERIAVGGGLGREWDLLAPVAMAAMRERVEAPEYRPVPEVVPAALGADAGVVGAALLVLEGR